MNITNFLDWMHERANGRSCFSVQFFNDDHYITINVHVAELPWVDFDGEEPMLIEDASDEFLTKLMKS